MRAKKKVSKRMLALLLSAVLITEPAFGTTVYATEQSADQMPAEGAEETQENSEEKETDDISGTQEGEETNVENPDKGDENPDSQENPGGNENQGDRENPGENENPDNQENSGENENPDDQENPVEDEETPDEEQIEDENGKEEPDQEIEGDEDISVSDNTLEEEENQEDDKFSEMPAGYRLSSEQKEMKSALSASMGQFDESQEGKTYVERQVFAFADSKEEAEDIANAYCAELIEFDEGVAVLELKEDTSVGEALMIASDMENNLPAVYPDYYRYAYGEEIPQENASLTVVEEEYELEEHSADESLSEEPALEAYAEAVQALGDPNMRYDSEYYQWQHVNVGSVYAWDAGYKGQGVKVAVLDTGVTPNGNDSVNCTKHIDKTEENNSTDGNAHGTHVAGIIAAELNNKGGAGIAPEAEIIDIKVLDSAGSGKDSNIIQGINAAKNENVDIMNMSLGGIGYNPAVEKVVNEAYKSGIAIFVASGNDGGTNMAYPAALDNVICVGAVDNNNQRASFSNYGSWVDLSAPGVDIWSIAIADDSDAVGGFRLMSGTSQATPVAAGEAAVILSAKVDSLNGKSGADRVKELKRIMQSNTVGAGSGMGKGVTSLTKVFKLSVATAKPGAPTISATDTSNNTAQSMSITIDSQAGMKICYTTNGKNPSFKNGETGADTILVDNNTVTFSVDGQNAAKGTVKAMAVNASGVAGPVKSFTYTLKPYVKTIVISGPTRVEKKKAIQLTATITPTYASNKNITWTLLTEGGQAVPETQIRFDKKKGKITTTDQAVAGKYKVTATAQDNPDQATVARSEDYIIEVVEADTAIQKIAFNRDVKKELWIKTTPSASTLSLFEYVTAQDKGADKKLKDITDREGLAKRLQWTSSKPAVATVDSTTGKVTAKAVGTTSITVKADDNLGKKASVSITVKQAVTEIIITTDKGKTAEKNFTVAVGKSIALKANISPVKPTSKKVNWSIAPGTGNAATTEDMKNVTINKSNGKVTVKAAAKEGEYVVTAEAADGQGEKATKAIKVVGGAIGEITLPKAEQKVTLYTKNISADKSNTKTITATIKGVKDKQGNYGTFDPNSYMVTNSNESVVKVESITDSTPGTVAITLKSTGTMFGKANIVIASTDGSNKKATCAVTVSGGISKVEIVDTQGGATKVSKRTLFRKGTAKAADAPSTTKLYAKITGSDGANLTAYNVTSNNSLVKVTDFNTTTGEISLEASATATGKAVITVMATDGSKKKATCTVTVVNPISKINIAPKGGNSGYVAKGKSLQLQATLESEYGVVSNKKVTWELTGGTNIDINKSSGKITAKSNATGSGTNRNQVTVIAKACDGSNVQAKYTVYISDPVKYLFLAYRGSLVNPRVCQPVKLITQTEDQDVNDRDKLGGAYVFDLAWFDEEVEPCGLSGGVTVASSNPSVMSATVQYPQSGGISVALSADKVGSATITVKAMDGSGTQVKYKFKVVR